MSEPTEDSVERANAIGCWPPAESGTTDLAEPGMFVRNDRSVINWMGENYYLACGAPVSRTDDGGCTSCVKPKNHPGEQHEDFEGRTKDEWNLQLGVLSLDAAVATAIGAASTCWEVLDDTGEFLSDKAKDITEQLLERIHQAGPIFE